MRKSAWVQSLVFILATAAVLIGPLVRSSAEAQDSQQDEVEVTISVFSGREDPRFQVDEGKPLDELRARLKSADRQVDPPAGGVLGPSLGYRGIVVRSRGDVCGLPAGITVFNHVIEVVSGDQRAYFADEGRALERYLIDLALEYEAITQAFHDGLVAELTSER